MTKFSSDFMDSGSISLHEQTVMEVLGAAYRKQGHGVVAVSSAPTLDALLEEEAKLDSVEQFARIEAFRKLLQYVFAEGPDPARTMRRMYALGKSYAPELLLNMSDQQIGMLFSETRAAVSWRRDQLVTKKLSEAGFRGTHVRCQKSETARKSYSKAQRGNRNRASAAAISQAA